MTSFRKIEVEFEDRSPHKWCVPLTENVFHNLIAKGSPTVHTVFGDGSLFSPLLFGKFFDPSDAFPLWEFESDILLAKARSSSQTNVEWSETEAVYVLKAELPGTGKTSVKVYVEDGKVVEISGLWKLQKEPNTKDWRGGHWWEHGYVRRLELPEDTDWRKLDASVNDAILEIRIPKKKYSDGTRGSDDEDKAS